MNLTATRGQAFQCKHVFYKAVLAALLPFVYQKLKRGIKEKYDYQMVKGGFKIKTKYVTENQNASSDSFTIRILGTVN